MTPKDLISIHTNGNSCRDALTCGNMALKLPWCFSLLMENPLDCYFQIWSPYYQAAQCNEKILPCANMTLKLPWYFYLLMKKPLACYFQVWSPYYQAAQCNEKILIPISSRWQVRSERAKRRLSINANHNYHQLSSP